MNTYNYFDTKLGKWRGLAGEVIMPQPNQTDKNFIKYNKQMYNLV